MLELAARFISVHRAACSGAASPSPETVPTRGESRTGAVHVRPTLAIVPSGTWVELPREERGMIAPGTRPLAGAGTGSAAETDGSVRRGPSLGVPDGEG